MVETLEGFGNGGGHVEVDCAIGIVPLQANTAEDVAVQIGDGIVFPVQVGDEVEGILAVGVFNTKVVDNEDEGDGLGAVFEEAGGDASGDVVTQCEMGK